MTSWLGMGNSPFLGILSLTVVFYLQLSTPNGFVKAVPPEFTNIANGSQFYLSDAATTNTVILTIKATDPDGLDPLQYSIEDNGGGNFGIDQTDPKTSKLIYSGAPGGLVDGESFTVRLKVTGYASETNVVSTTINVVGEHKDKLLSCPPALADRSYNITTEVYDVMQDVLDANVTLLFNGQRILTCGTGTQQCSFTSGWSGKVNPTMYELWNRDDIRFQFQLTHAFTSGSNYDEGMYTVLWQFANQLSFASNCDVMIGTPVNECTLALCMYTDSCIDEEIGYNCVCERGYHGLNCDQGDEGVYCPLDSITMNIPQQQDVCNDDSLVHLDCYVASDPGHGGQLTVQEVSPSGDPRIRVNPSIVNDTVNLQVCTTKGAPAGRYEVNFTIGSSMSTTSFNYSVRVIIDDGQNVGPKFVVTPISVPEDLKVNDVIVYVNKSRDQICTQNSQEPCLEVIDIDLNPKFGIESLRVSAIHSDPGISFVSMTDAYSVGYYKVSGTLTPLKQVISLLEAFDGGGASATASVIFNILDVNDPPICAQGEIVVNDWDLHRSPDDRPSIGIFICVDPDVDPNNKVVIYSIDNMYNAYFTVDQFGNVQQYADLTALGPGVHEFNVTLTNSELVMYLPVIITLVGPPSVCTLTNQGQRPSVWQVGSQILLEIECQASALQLLNTTFDGPSVSVDLIPSGNNALNLLLTLDDFFQGQFEFTATVNVDDSSVKELSISLPLFNPPVFNVPNPIKVQETAVVGVSVIQLTAKTGYNGSVLTYSAKGGNATGLFSVDTLGLVWVESSLSKSAERSFRLVVQATDSITTLTAEVDVNIFVEDVNQAPTCSGLQDVTVASDKSVGSEIATVSCTDGDVREAFRRLTYRVTTSPPSVNLSTESVNSGKIILMDQLPRGVERAQVNITASDSQFSKQISFTLLIRIVKCPDITERNIFFPETPVGFDYNASCPTGYNGNIRRVCVAENRWGNFTLNECSRKDLEVVIKQVENLAGTSANTSTVASIARTVSDSLKKSPSVISGDVKSIVNILSKVGLVIASHPDINIDHNTLEDFAAISDTLLSASSEVWEETDNTAEILDETGEQNNGAGMLIAMDTIANASLRSLSEGAPVIRRDNIVIQRALAIDDIVYPERNGMNSVGADIWPGSTAFLGKDAFQSLGVSVGYSVVIFKSSSGAFRVSPELQNKYNTGNLKDKQIQSDVLSFTVNVSLPTLEPALKLTFVVDKQNFTGPVCGFLDTSVSEVGLWSTEGCITISSENDNNQVRCECSHLTNFAVLMSPYGLTNEKDQLALSIITYIGCGISILCLIVTIIVHAVLWKYVKSDRSILHVHLSVILILGYTVFLAGVSHTEDKDVCTTVAALLHFLFLVVFFIMLSEGIEILRSVTFVFDLNSIICRLLSLAYITPAVIVAISLGVTKTEGYGNENFCWLSMKDGLLWAFVGPVLTIFLINFIILIHVLRTMQKTRHMMNKKSKDKAKSVVRTIFVLSPILGITWILGVLSVNEDLVVFQYMFAICNSLQGFFIFICYCFLPPQLRDGFRAMRRKSRAKSFDSDQKMVSSSDNRRKSLSSSGLHNNGTASPTTDRTFDYKGQGFANSDSSSRGFSSSSGSNHFSNSGGRSAINRGYDSSGEMSGFSPGSNGRGQNGGRYDDQGYLSPINGIHPNARSGEELVTAFGAEGMIDNPNPVFRPQFIRGQPGMRMNSEVDSLALPDGDGGDHRKRGLGSSIKEKWRKFSKRRRGERTGTDPEREKERLRQIYGGEVEAIRPGHFQQAQVKNRKAHDRWNKVKEFAKGQHRLSPTGQHKNYHINKPEEMGAPGSPLHNGHYDYRRPSGGSIGGNGFPVIPSLVINPPQSIHMEEPRADYHI